MHAVELEGSEGWLTALLERWHARSMRVMFGGISATPLKLWMFCLLIECGQGSYRISAIQSPSNSWKHLHLRSWAAEAAEHAAQSPHRKKRFRSVRYSGFTAQKRSRTSLMYVISLSVIRALIEEDECAMELQLDGCTATASFSCSGIGIGNIHSWADSITLTCSLVCNKNHGIRSFLYCSCLAKSQSQRS